MTPVNGRETARFSELASMDTNARSEELLSRLDVIARDLERSRLAAGAQASLQAQRSEAPRPESPRPDWQPPAPSPSTTAHDDGNVVPLGERSGSAFTYIKPRPVTEHTIEELPGVTITRPVDRTLDHTLGYAPIDEPSVGLGQSVMHDGHLDALQPSAVTDNRFVEEYTRVSRQLTDTATKLASETARRISAEHRATELEQRLEAARAIVHEARSTANEAADRAAYAEGRVDSLEDALDRALTASIFTKWRWRRWMKQQVPPHRR